MKKIFTPVLLLLASHFSFSQWNNNPAINNPISTAANRQSQPRSVTDGTGGAIITWMDYNGTNNIYKVYAQRINAAGITKWATNGIAVCTNAAAQQYPQIISDSNGGAIIMWFDSRGNSGMYAQRVSANGVLQWAADGVAIAGEFILREDITLTPLINITDDGRGGAIIAWADGRDVNGYYLYAQRISAGAVLKWGGGIGGLPVCTLNGVWEPKLISDNNKGAFIAFANYSGSFPTGRYDIYAQRIDENGAEKWGTNGKPVCRAAENQKLPEITNDGKGGAIIAWQDKRSSFNTNSNIYVQRLNSKGDVLWNTDGISVSPIQNIENVQQEKQKLIRDSSGGTIICWSDNRTGRYNVFSQRITKAGALNWTTSGVQVSPENYVGSPAPQLVTDRNNGAIICWNGTLANNNFTDIEAQRLNARGVIKWASGGVSVCTAADNQSEPQMITDTIGETILCWTDNRNNTSVNTSDIFASRINANGKLSNLAAPLNPADFSANKPKSRPSSLISISPDPANSFINIFYTGKKEMITLSIYNAEGKLLKHQTQKNVFPLQVKVNDLLPGTYFIYLSDGVTVNTEKFIKQ